MLGLTVVISLVFESTGVATGLMYGGYHYTTFLGPRFLDLVPFLIPISWFMMLYPSYVMAVRIMPVKEKNWQNWLKVAAIGGLIMTAWDLVLDPLMVARGHWVWEVKGAYFGIPLQNYLGWWLTSVLILALYSWGSHRWTLREPHPGLHFERLAVASYAITGFGSVIGAVFEGLGGPALAGFLAMFPWILISWMRR